jgi:hypothetical protein
MSWTNIGIAYNTDVHPIHTYLTKTCEGATDLFLHPRTTVFSPIRSRKYTLLAKNGEGGRLHFAVQAGNDPIIVLPCDPRYHVDCIQQAWVELKEGDLIYIPGELGAYHVHFWAEEDIYRQNHSVFRGYSPVGRLSGRITTTNSGLRNFSALPDSFGMLRPF